MNIITNRQVPKDRRTQAEISANSVAGAIHDHETNANSASAARTRLRFGHYVLDLERGCLEAHDKEVALRPKTFDFLRYLALNHGRLVTKDELMGAVWPDVVVTDDSIVQCVTELRRVLADTDHRLIATIQKRGYRFDAPLSAEPADAGSYSSVDATGAVQRGDAVPHHAVVRRIVLSRPVAIVTLLIFLASAGSGVWWWYANAERFDAPPPLSIIVLPFKNSGGDPAQEYFSSGVSNDLSTELSRLPGTFVIAHASARTLAGRDIDARQVGRSFNVRYLLDGSVRRNADMVRINVQLISAATGATVWAERFERRHDQLAHWHDEVVGRIATTLNFRLTRLESERSLRERPGDPEAFDLTSRGWALVYAAKTPANYHAARKLFRQALESDSEAVNALAGVGWTSAVIVLDGWSTSITQDIAAADAAVTRALALDSHHFIAHHVRGFLFRLDKRPEAARDSFRAAIAINPNFAPGYAQLGATEIELGRPEAGIPAVERAMRLSPRDPSLGPWLAIVGIANLHLGRYEESATWLTRAVETGTPVARQRAYLASALALCGRLTEARAALAEFRRARPAATISRLRATARSTNREFVTQQERFFEGLRIAGLPE